MPLVRAGLELTEPVLRCFLEQANRIEPCAVHVVVRRSEPS